MSGINMQLTVQVEGREWRLFDVNYTDADGRTMSFYIYAINREHASYQVAEIRNTAVLAPGDIVDIHKR